MFITVLSMVLIGVTPCCCISKGVIRDCDHVYSGCSCGMGVAYHIAYKESCSHGIFLPLLQGHQQSQAVLDIMNSKSPTLRAHCHIYPERDHDL